MKYSMIALSMLAVGANAACTADETKKIATCVAGITAATDKAGMCKYYQGMLACYTSCYCDEAATAKALEDGYTAALKLVGVDDCTLKCGSGSMLAPGMALALTVFAATYSQYE